MVGEVLLDVVERGSTAQVGDAAQLKGMPEPQLFRFAPAKGT
ncbi:hypothetical protein [Streptomyces antimycoticus]